MLRLMFQKDHSGRFTRMYTGGKAGTDPDHYRNIGNKCNKLHLGISKSYFSLSKN